MLQSLNPDIISLNETHLVAEDVVELSGYSWFGNNRKRHIKAPKGSSGVGFLVRSELFEHFKIKVMDKFVDDIIGVHFEHRNTSYNFVVFSCYLSPEGSVRGRDCEVFFAHLLTQMYSLEVDAIYICGDFNCRIADKADCIEGLDNIPPRVALDLVCNSHGDSFLDLN